MRICAVVLNYCNAAKTKACLRSLEGQGVDQVLVVDNSDSSSHSAELAEMLQRQGEIADYGLHLLKPQINLGFARGVNMALQSLDAVFCEAILLINNDAVAAPGMVGKLAAALIPGETPIVAPVVLDATGVPQPMLWYQRFFGLQTKAPLPGSFPYLSGCCMLVHRTMLDRGKLFDDAFFMYGEDTLLGWQMAYAHQPIQCVSGAVVSHIGGGSSRQCQLFYEYHTARAHVLLAVRTRKSVLELPLLLVSKSIGMGLRALRRSIRCGTGIPLLAFILAWFPLKIRVP